MGQIGIDLLRQAKQRWPDLPFAMITAYGDEECRNRAIQSGASDFLVKPLDFEELKTKIATMLADGDDKK